MDSYTGDIIQSKTDQIAESFSQLIDEANKLQSKVNDLIGKIDESKRFVELGNLPDKTCPKCGGKGYRPPGMNSRYFIPCECTNPE